MAGDGNGAVNGANGVEDVFKQDKDKGRVAVHTFDPNASPAQKAAAAGKGKEQLKGVQQKSEQGGERGHFQTLFCNSAIVSHISP